MLRNLIVSLITLLTLSTTAYSGTPGQLGYPWAPSSNTGGIQFSPQGKKFIGTKNDGSPGNTVGFVNDWFTNPTESLTWNSDGSFTFRSPVIFAGGTATTYFIDVTQQPYFAKCDGITDDSVAITNADTVALTRSQALVLPARACFIGANTSLSSPIIFYPGSSFSVANGITLTLTGSIYAGNYRIFNWAGTGLVSIQTSSTINVMWWGVVANDPGDGSGTDNVASLQKMSSGLTNNARVYIPPAPSNMYYRISGLGATAVNLITGISITSLTGVEIFGSGDNSRFYMSDWSNADFDVAGAPGNNGYFTGILLTLSNDISIHDIAFYGQYGINENFPAGALYVRASAIKLLGSSRCQVHHVKGYNIVGNTVTVQLNGAILSTDVDVLDSYFENNAENAIDHLGGAVGGKILGNTFVNCWHAMEPKAPGVVMDSNIIRYTSTYGHLTSGGSVGAIAILDKSRSSVVTNNILEVENYTALQAIILGGQNDTAETINGTFADDTGWTLGAGWAAAGTLTHAAGNATSATNTQFTPTKGEMYQVTVTLVVNTAGTLSFYIGGNSYTLATSGSVAGGASYTLTFHAECGVTDTTWRFTSDAVFDGTLDTLSISHMKWGARDSVVSGNTIRGFYAGPTGAVRVTQPANGSVIENNTLANLTGNVANNWYAIHAAGEDNVTGGSLSDLVLRDVISPLTRIRIQGNIINAPGLKFGVFMDRITESALVANTIRTNSYAASIGTNYATLIDYRDNSGPASGGAGLTGATNGVTGWKISDNRGNSSVTPIQGPLSGAAAGLTDGATITHGMGGSQAPTSCTVTGSVATEYATITSKSATTITVAIKKRVDGTAGTAQTVYWHCDN